MRCPYCAACDADTKDHVFAEFLGGKAWVLACKTCNSTFGHSFEAKAFAPLKDLMFHLRRSGMQPPKPMVWKGMAVGPIGEKYDIDQDLNAIPSTPSIERDELGRIVRASGGRHHVEQIRKSLERDGRRTAITPQTIQLEVRQLRMAFPMDDNLKRLCVKMSIAAATLLERPLALDDTARRYLIDGDFSDVCPVRISSGQYPELDRQRPLAGHLVYVRASSAERRVYSVVQLFAAIHFYCELAGNYEGPDWAACATHAPIDHPESFELTPLLDYRCPERWLQQPIEEYFQAHLEHLRLDLVTLYGDQAPERLSTKA